MSNTLGKTSFFFLIIASFALFYVIYTLDDFLSLLGDLNQYGGLATVFSIALAAFLGWFQFVWKENKDQENEQKQALDHLNDEICQTENNLNGWDDIKSKGGFGDWKISQISLTFFLQNLNDSLVCKKDLRELKKLLNELYSKIELLNKYWSLMYDGFAVHMRLDKNDNVFDNYVPTREFNYWHNKMHGSVNSDAKKFICEIKCIIKKYK